MQVTNSGSVRVDLVGGTLDISPIHLILPNVVTLNVATELKAKVKIDSLSTKQIKIISKDYNKIYQYDLSELSIENFDNDHFEEMSFILQIVHYFKPEIGLEVTLESGAPAGSGLGGSSAMGVTLFKALCDFFSYPFEKVTAIKIVQSIESRILNQGVPGYQDYYPAYFGGVLALSPNYHEVKVEQLFSEELKNFLETNITLIYSGQSRKSGINNWEVYKSFFDGVESVRSGMMEIAKVSHAAYQSILKKDYSALLENIKKEGVCRENLFPNIVSSEIKAFMQNLKNDLPNAGLKMCGAGGGGCFILVHGPNDRKIVESAVEKAKMNILDFTISNPIV